MQATLTTAKSSTTPIVNAGASPSNTFTYVGYKDDLSNFPTDDPAVYTAADGQQQVVNLNLEDLFGSMYDDLKNAQNGNVTRSAIDEYKIGAFYADLTNTVGPSLPGFASTEVTVRVETGDSAALGGGTWQVVGTSIVGQNPT